jgi:hypothetical protein
VISLVVLFALARYARVTRLFAFGLIVWALASLPSILILDNNYVLGSPRLYYLPSVGVALTCAIPILSAERLLKPEIGYWRWGTWGLMLALCLLPTAGYTRCELTYQGMAGEVGRMMAAATRTVPPGQEVTFVNLPYFFSSRGKGTECRNPFVFAPTGAVVIPPYGDARDFVFYNGGLDVPISAVAVREYQPGWQTRGEATSVERLRQWLVTSRVFVFDLLQWRLFDLSAVWQPGVSPSQPKATFEGVQISNLKSQISNSTGVVTLTWQSMTGVRDRKVFVHIYDSSGKVAAQDDSMPAQGFVPTSWWRPGDVITDTHIIPLTNLPPGTYRMTAGMYDAITSTRIEAHSADGMRLQDDEITIAELTR